MADTGLKPFTVCVSGGSGDDNWFPYANIADDNTGTYAEATGRRGDVSSTTKATGADLSVMGDADVVTGIELQAELYADDIDVFDEEMWLWITQYTKAPSNLARSSAFDWPTTKTIITWGGPGELWGLSSPTGADLKVSWVGMGLKCLLDGNNNVDARISRSWIKVYYTAAGGGGGDTTQGFFALLGS